MRFASPYITSHFPVPFPDRLACDLGGLCARSKGLHASLALGCPASDSWRGWHGERGRTQRGSPNADGHHPTASQGREKSVDFFSEQIA